MDHDVLVAIRDLLSSTRVLATAVIVDGEPEAALLPFAVRADFGAVYSRARSTWDLTRSRKSRASI